MMQNKIQIKFYIRKVEFDRIDEKGFLHVTNYNTYYVYLHI